MCRPLLTVVCLIIGILYFHVPVIDTENITAFPADSFVESIGVNVHWAYSGVYTSNYTRLKMKLAELGIRYLRDRTHPGVYIRATDLYKSLGIRTLLIAGRFRPSPSTRILDPAQIDEELNEIKTQALSAAVALEGPNEYDLEHISDPNWEANLRNYSICLYTKSKADELLKSLPVLGPSLTSLEAYEGVGDLDPYIDYANLHIYFSTDYPGFPGRDANGTKSLTWFLHELARRQSPSGKGVQATETGYHNDYSHGGLSEEADGKYMARTLMEFFRRGISRSYKYELVNENLPAKEGVFGLLRHDLTEKSAFRIVKNLIALFNDKGPTFQPKTLDYTLNGSINDVRQVLFQKRNGDFYLVVWAEVPSWNKTTKTDLYPPPQPVVLTVQDSGRISTATLYSFSTNADMIITHLNLSENRINFNATDQISVLQLSTAATHSMPNGL